MSATKRVRKRCDRCGKTSLVRPADRMCWRTTKRGFGKFGNLSYCGGALKKMARRRRIPASKDDSNFTEQYRLAVEKKLVKAQAGLSYARQRLKRFQTAVRQWEQKVKHLDRLLSSSDAEIQARRERARKAAQVSARVQAVRRRVAGVGKPETAAQPA